MSILRHIVRGCGTLPNYGSHPGTFMLAAMGVLGWAMAGTLGGIAMLIVFGPAYLLGAYQRSVGDPPTPDTDPGTPSSDPT